MPVPSLRVYVKILVYKREGEKVRERERERERGRRRGGNSSLVAPETRNLCKPRVENHFKRPIILSLFLIQKNVGEEERMKG